ncbi:ClpXP protease specificity-enhancing factor [Variovorax sp. OV329]|uniref:ClpXP protease specificity-enhancing factor n=1 Tax=Variovorax sp. OV329 TaxID=1882825 RepID=UPI0008E70140|nr:ClpXP protease specificity-enhancing factor [Variovorax sp. OV329]SFM20151.1 stringent starvation protein B [Variovorax sp. OV329]
MISAIESSSTRPYLIRALYEWCTDNGFTPYIAVQVDDGVQVPREYVKNGEIVLNISFDATSSLKLGNDFIEFKARFAGSAREIIVPVGRVIAIYARENGQGMAFPAPAAGSQASTPAPVPVVPVTSSGAKSTSRQTAETDPARVVHLVTGDAEAGAATPVASGPAGDDEPPKPPASSGGARPSLKRVK